MIEFAKYKFTLLVAYAPTLIISEQNPAIREDSNESLSEFTNRIKKRRHMITPIGNFNAKIGTVKTEYPENIGKYGNGRFNTNAKCLLDYTKEHDMILCSSIRCVIEPPGLSLRE